MPYMDIVGEARSVQEERRVCLQMIGPNELINRRHFVVVVSRCEVRRQKPAKLNQSVLALEWQTKTKFKKKKDFGEKKIWRGCPGTGMVNEKKREKLTSPAVPLNYHWITPQEQHQKERGQGKQESSPRPILTEQNRSTNNTKYVCCNAITSRTWS